MEDKNYIIEIFSMINKFSKLIDGECSLDKLSMWEFSLLNVIKQTNLDNGKCNLTNVSKRLAVSKSAVTQSVSKLTKKGLINKTGDSADSRVYYLTLTEQGQEQLELGYAEIGERINLILSELTNDELVNMFELMNKVYMITEKVFKER